MNNAPQWFTAEVATGLQRLIAIGLQGTPASEVIGATAESWIAALWHSRQWQEQQAPQLQQAFIRCCSQIERWPSPKQVLALLPPVAENSPLPPVAISPEKRQQRLNQLAEFKRRFACKTAVRK